MTAEAVKYANLEKYVYWLLLATIAVIPLQQEVSSAMVAVTGFSGFIVAFLRVSFGFISLFSITLWQTHGKVSSQVC